jgi:hypothetical protein
MFWGEVNHFNMKAKIIIITVLFLLQSQSLFSQCISIELSVTWERGGDIFKKDSAVSTPILNITYRNNCNTNYYFFKASPSRDVSMAFNASLHHFNKPIDYQQNVKSSCKRGARGNFNVIMGNIPWYKKGWEALNDSIDHNKRLSSEPINFWLNNIYAYFCSPIDYTDYEKFLPLAFESSDITPENILGLFNDQFVFLKPGETHIDTYNLIGFKLVEGCFTFIIDQKEIKDYVLGPGIDGFGIMEIELPAVVGEYQLFSGAFNTNKVTVCFGEK